MKDLGSWLRNRALPAERWSEPVWGPPFQSEGVRARYRPCLGPLLRSSGLSLWGTNIVYPPTGARTDGVEWLARSPDFIHLNGSELTLTSSVDLAWTGTALPHGPRFQRWQQHSETCTDEPCDTAYHFGNVQVPTHLPLEVTESRDFKDSGGKALRDLQQ